MNDYIKKILSKLSNPSWAIKNRNDFVDVYGLSDDEYLKGIVDFEFKSLKKLEGEFFSTLTYKNSGTYDFVFKVSNLQFINYGSGIQSVDGNSLFGEVIRIYVEIDQGGTVEITDELGPATVFINDKLISDGDIGWEIDSEVRELVIEMILTKETELFNNIRTYDIIEIYVEYPKE